VLLRSLPWWRLGGLEGQEAAKQKVLQGGRKGERGESLKEQVAALYAHVLCSPSAVRAPTWPHPQGHTHKATPMWQGQGHSRAPA